MNTFYPTSIRLSPEAIDTLSDLAAKIHAMYPEPDMTITTGGKPRECSIDEWKSTAP